MIERDPTYDVPGRWLKLLCLVPALMLLFMWACPNDAAAQNYCVTSTAASRTLVTTPAAGARFLLMNESCPGSGTPYSAMEMSALLLLTGRVREHATSCTGTTAIAPSICYERDDDTIYICDLAAGSSCTAANWTAIAGGGGGGDVTAVGECSTGACFGGQTMVTSATTVAGDVDGTGVAALDLDEAAVETELESVLDLPQMQGEVTAAQIATSAVATDELLNGTILAEDLKAVDSPVDEECLTKEDTTGDFEWQACGAGSGDITDVFSCASGDCASITMAATDFLDMSGTDASTTTEGLKLPQHATACAGGTDEGQVCWEADANKLWIGNGATLTEIGTDGAGDITDVFNCSSGDCASIVAGATDLLDFSANDASTTTEGLILPQHATACAGGTTEGQVCWEADANKLYIGNGATLTEVGAGSASPEYNPDNYPPGGDTLLSDEFTSGATLTWTAQNADSQTIVYVGGSALLGRDGVSDAWHGMTTPAPADNGQDWYVVAKVHVGLPGSATRGCGVSLINGGTAASPTEIDSFYLRCTSATVCALELADHDDYDFAGETSIGSLVTASTTNDVALQTGRAVYVSLAWFDATEDIGSAWSWDGMQWGGVGGDTTVDGYPSAIGVFSRDDAACSVEWVRVLDTDVDANLANGFLKVGS
jgi:hypothetical protein